jgi:hypothetical protein
MEDIRFEKDKVKMQKSVRFNKFLFHIRKNWWKYLIVVVVVFVVVFPDVTGQILGSWWNSFITSFLGKLTH